MSNSRNLANFKDGHSENIYYYSKKSDGSIEFATESGIYLYSNRVKMSHTSELLSKELSMKSPMPVSNFFTITYSSFYNAALIDETYDIESIVINDEVSYEYTICGDGAYLTGVVTVPGGSDDETIRKAVAKSLDIRYIKKENIYS